MLHQIGQSHGDQRSKLEAVSREACREDDVVELRVMIHDEVLIGCHSVEAGSRTHQPRSRFGIAAREPGHVFCSHGGNRVQVGLAGGRDRAIGIRQVTAAFVLRHLDPHAGNAGESIDQVFRKSEDRYAIRREKFRSHRIEPRDHLPLDCQRQTKFAQQAPRPGARRDDQFCRSDGCVLQVYADFACRRVPSLHGLIEYAFDAKRLCPGKTGGDRRIHIDPARPGIKKSDVLVLKLKCWIAEMYFICR